MKKTKYKVKKSVWKVMGIVLVLLVAIFIGKKVIDNIEYKKTYEYKLLEKGYASEDVKLIEKNLDSKSIDNLIQNEKNEFVISLVKEKYYLKRNYERYMKYYAEHKNEKTAKIVSIVNTNNDYDYYDYDIDTDIKKDTLLIVNKYYHLSNDYEPDDLVNISNNYYYGSNHKTRKQTYEAFIDMWNDAKKEDIYLIINSSYRTYEEQKDVYEDYKSSGGTKYADSIAARPGYSEHQTGLSLDIFSKDSMIASTFKDSKAYLWLKDNAHRYGFIQRYQKEFEDLTGFAEETWHWRYVGVDAATYIHDNNITFDEYYAYFIEK